MVTVSFPKRKRTKHKDNGDKYEITLEPFGVILDIIWQACNNYVFNGKVTNFSAMLMKGKALVTTISKNRVMMKQFGSSFQRSLQRPPICWNPPPCNSIKLNVDASIADAGFKVSCGGVGRDHRGEFLFGFAKKMNRCTVEEAEMRAVLNEISMVVERGYRDVWVESDSAVVIELLLAGGSGSHPLSSIIEEIKNMFSGVCMVRWTKIPRKLNQVADILAKFSLSSSSNCTIFESASHFILSILLEDKMGIVLV